MEECRKTFTTQFVDRSQLRVMNGNLMGYYQDLAHDIGCFPTFWKILTQRPTAFWHAYLVFFGAINQQTNRLVGPGRLENAEEWIEQIYESRHFGRYKDSGAGYDHNPKVGELKNGDGLGPANRRGNWMYKSMQDWYKFHKRLTDLRAANPEWESCEGIPFVGKPQPYKLHLKQNLEYALKDMERGIHHSLELNEEIKDGFQDKGGDVTYAFARAAKTSADGGLADLEVPAYEEVAAGGARSKM